MVTSVRWMAANRCPCRLSPTAANGRLSSPSSCWTRAHGCGGTSRAASARCRVSHARCCRRVDGHGWGAGEHTHTLVATRMGGRGRAAVRRAPPVHGHGGARSPRGEQGRLARLYHTELGKCSRCGGAAERRHPDRRAVGVRRDVVSLDAVCRRTCILVGDAASFIEPLSAAGVEALDLGVASRWSSTRACATAR